jgi:hypothetical protein
MAWDPVAFSPPELVRLSAIFGYKTTGTSNSQTRVFVFFKILIFNKADPFFENPLKVFYKNYIYLSQR